MDNAVATALIESTWDGSITPSLIDYIRIPNKSPAFDPDWKANGHMDDEVAPIADDGSVVVQDVPQLLHHAHGMDGGRRGPRPG